MSQAEPHLLYYKLVMDVCLDERPHIILCSSVSLYIIVTTSCQLRTNQSFRLKILVLVLAGRLKGMSSTGFGSTHQEMIEKPGV